MVDWYGKPLTARGLAQLLEPYGVRPVKRRVDGEQSRAYYRSDLADSWGRYVPDQTPETPQTPQPPQGPVGPRDEAIVAALREGPRRSADLCGEVGFETERELWAAVHRLRGAGTPVGYWPGQVFTLGDRPPRDTR